MLYVLDGNAKLTVSDTENYNNLERSATMSDNDKDEKTCPILHSNCLKEKCAWWVTEEERCAILEIAKSVS